MQRCFRGALRPIPALVETTSHCIYEGYKEFKDQNGRTLRILISLPNKLWDFDKFFLVIDLMATVRPGFCNQ